MKLYLENELLTNRWAEIVGLLSKYRRLSLRGHRKRAPPSYVTLTCPCIKAKESVTHDCAPMDSIASSFPLEIVCIDDLHLEASCGSYEDILVISLDVLRHKEHENKQQRFGPSKLHHSQESECENKVN